MNKNKIARFTKPLLTAMTVGALSMSMSSMAAEDFPSKPINYILPFNAGGESDLSARFQQTVFEKHAGVKTVIRTCQVLVGRLRGRS